MIQGYTPQTPSSNSSTGISESDLQQLIMAGKILGAVIVIGCIVLAVIWLVKHISEKHKDYWRYWNQFEKYLKSSNISAGYQKYVCVPFKQFHQYYSLNPERYDLKSGAVYVKQNPEDEVDKADFKYVIIFKKREYKKYKKWVEQSTNGMHDPAAVTDTLGYLSMVQADIQAIRDKEAQAVSESQKAMQKFMDSLSPDKKLDFHEALKQIEYPMGKPSDEDEPVWAEE